LLYIWNGYRRAIKLIEKKEITTVYTSFMPYADHVIGCLLKRKYPHLIWIADFRDLHLEPIYKNTLWPSLQQRFEKRILSQANIVTSVSDGLCDKLKDYHHNVVTITKGVTVRPEQQLYDQFTISYVGGLFGEYRDPRPVFKAIQSWRKSVNSFVRFLYVGKDGGQMRTWARECGMEDIFVDGGFIKREEASLVQDCSHINLLLTSSSVEHKGVLTGKLFDYIESRRPILCSVNGVYDEELESLFKQYKLGQIFYPEQEFKVVQYIDYMYTEWEKTGALAGVSNIKLLEETLSWDGQARKLMDRID
jgi:hypothetical protein